MITAVSKALSKSQPAGTLHRSNDSSVLARLEGAHPAYGVCLVAVGAAYEILPAHFVQLHVLAMAVLKPQPECTTGDDNQSSRQQIGKETYCFHSTAPARLPQQTVASGLKIGCAR
jgi:hypothetical protein